MKLRPYQTEAVNAVYDFLRNKDTNPCVVAPTASGKSLMIAQIVNDAVSLWNGRVLILAHVKELLEQNAAKIKALCPTVDIGIHSAGLGEAALTNQVIVAGIQSVYKKADKLGKFDIVLVDECHLIPTSGDGMYRTFLTEAKKINPIIRVIGFTATPFRLNGGLICKPNNILNEICYDIKIPYLIEHGYISKLVSREGETDIKFSKLHKRANEFVPEEVEQVMNSEQIINLACSEIVKLTKLRKKVIIFGCSVNHCEEVSKRITALTKEECPVITGETPADERAYLLDRFKGVATEDLFGEEKAKPLKFLCNVNVLTTGFDAPAIDCVVLLRPTASAALYIQMVGRGFRLAPGKENCLILDYGGNVLRHGPVNDVDVIDMGEEEEEEKTPRICPKCRTHVSRKSFVCPECGHTFRVSSQKEAIIRHKIHASTNAIVGERLRTPKNQVTYEVSSVHYRKHRKHGDPFAPPSLKLELSVKGELMPIYLWKAPESKSQWAKRQFENWWRKLSIYPHEDPPKTVDEALDRISLRGELKAIRGITLEYKNGTKQFPSDVDYQLVPYVPAASPSEFYDDLPF